MLCALQVEGGLARPDHWRFCSARCFKLSVLGAFLGFNIGLAVLLTALDEVELPGSTMTIFDAAEIAGYAFQTTRLFMLVITLLTAHQRRDWKVMSPADQSAAGVAMHQHHVVA